MTSKERFLAALRGNEVDRTPVAHVSALTTLELQESTGCSMPDVHHDPGQLVKLCGANHDELGFDAVTFIINFFNEPAALGCELNWGSRSELPVYVSHPWVQPEVIEKQVVKNIEAGVDIISPGCATSPECPNRNLRANPEAVQSYFGAAGK